MGKRRKRKGKGGGLGSLLTDQEKAIARLSKVAPKLASYENREFARSLLRHWQTQGRLTPKQWWWVGRLPTMPQRKRRERPIVGQHCFVYAVSAGDRIKIGRSDNPVARLKAIQTGCPQIARLICTEEFFTKNAAHDRERQLHERFQSHRAHGEWFHQEIEDELVMLMRGEIQ